MRIVSTTATFTVIALIESVVHGAEVESLLTSSSSSVTITPTTNSKRGVRGVNNKKSISSKIIKGPKEQQEDRYRQYHRRAQKQPPVPCLECDAYKHCHVHVLEAHLSLDERKDPERRTDAKRTSYKARTTIRHFEAPSNGYDSDFWSIQGLSHRKRTTSLYCDLPT